MKTKSSADFNKQLYLGNINTALRCLTSMKSSITNPAFITKIEEIQNSLAWLSQHVENEVRYRKAESNIRPTKPNTKKPKPIHTGSPGRNATRTSSLYNPQGGFGKKATYHIKDYEDFS